VTFLPVVVNAFGFPRKLTAESDPPTIVPNGHSGRPLGTNHLALPHR
jgi:hypothetical protein